MSSTKKGNDWYFGREEDQKSIRGIDFPTRAHIGVDADSGVTHSLETSTAKLHDSQGRDALLHGEETSVRDELRLARHWSGRVASGAPLVQARWRRRRLKRFAFALLQNSLPPDQQVADREREF